MAVYGLAAVGGGEGLGELGFGYAGEDGDEEFTIEGGGEGGFGEEFVDHVGFAGQEDDVGGLDGGEVGVCEDCYRGGVGGEGGLELFGGFGTFDAGDEFGGEAGGGGCFVEGGGGAGGDGGGGFLVEGGEDAGEDCYAHCSWEES